MNMSMYAGVVGLGASAGLARVLEAAEGHMHLLYGFPPVPMEARRLSGRRHYRRRGGSQVRKALLPPRDDCLNRRRGGAGRGAATALPTLPPRDDYSAFLHPFRGRASGEYGERGLRQGASRHPEDALPQKGTAEGNLSGRACRRTPQKGVSRAAPDHLYSYWEYPVYLAPPYSPLAPSAAHVRCARERCRRGATTTTDGARRMTARLKAATALQPLQLALLDWALVCACTGAPRTRAGATRMRASQRAYTNAGGRSMLHAHAV